MKIPIVLIVLAALSPLGARGVCIIPDPSEPHKEANAFLATVVSEEIVGGTAALRHGEYYRVQYQYSVRDVLRGEAKTDLTLYSEVMYSDPAAEENIDVAEAFAYSPGDTLIVAFDTESEVQVSLCGPSTRFRGSLRRTRGEWAR